MTLDSTNKAWIELPVYKDLKKFGIMIHNREKRHLRSRLDAWEFNDLIVRVWEVVKTREL
jgi:hypothetical protein